jgi:hypothetical protein
MTMTLEELQAAGREQYGDWLEVFKYAKEPEAVPGFTGSKAGFTIPDVAKVLATVDGERDEATWLGAFKLKDGRWAALRAGCDFTGWG